ncbi:hypothetical protein [Cupriavidus lacunae]|nr:hypothetical protein [Cupriavidus lacunae]
MLYIRYGIAWVESRSQREGYALAVGNTHNSEALEDLMVELFRRASVT